MSLSTSATVCPATALSVVRLEDQCLKEIKHVGFGPVGLKPLCLQLHPFERRRNTLQAFRVQLASITCSAALNATCAAEQTQTVTRQSSTITVAPIQGKEKSPELDDGGTGFPPRDDGDGGGGGGGGGGHWSGGFFFFGFLAFLGFLKDQESEGPYREERRR
ncbi:class E basic helix-loop-helix 22-like [Olea europaea subsp. europaea]|uniref:Class E basic helix-loop-helix 22-like n=2 Tax=Olea europaea subsp. europaea TaxID=158383 RepID=A0A8S0VGV4_OLEEU|nr:class E basic helix-loop-helix 22-like [Olea europaea subsp. europaea]